VRRLKGSPAEHSETEARPGRSPRRPTPHLDSALYRLGAATFAEAHHGFNGRYDRSKPLYIEGHVAGAVAIVGWIGTVIAARLIAFS
jgi:hypothetical protein